MVAEEAISLVPPAAADSDAESDNSDRISVPSFQNSFSQAIEAAFLKLDKPSTSEQLLGKGRRKSLPCDAGQTVHARSYVLVAPRASKRCIQSAAFLSSLRLDWSFSFLFFPFPEDKKGKKKKQKQKLLFSTSVVHTK